MKNFWAKVVKEAKSPEARPVEIWVFRFVSAYVAVKLGIKVDHSV